MKKINATILETLITECMVNTSKQLSDLIGDNSTFAKGINMRLEERFDVLDAIRNALSGDTTLLRIYAKKSE